MQGELRAHFRYLMFADRAERRGMDQIAALFRALAASEYYHARSFYDAFIMTRNTILYNLAFIVLGNTFAIVCAIAMDTIKNRFFKRSSQIVILIPYLLSSVIVSYIVFAFLSPSSGFINHTVFGLLGIDPVNWYGDPKPWPVILVIVHLWMSFG